MFYMAFDYAMGCLVLYLLMSPIYFLKNIIKNCINKRFDSITDEIIFLDKNDVTNMEQILIKECKSGLNAIDDNFFFNLIFKSKRNTLDKLEDIQ